MSCSIENMQNTKCHLDITKVELGTILELDIEGMRDYTYVPINSGFYLRFWGSHGQHVELRNFNCLSEQSVAKFVKSDRVVKFSN